MKPVLLSSKRILSATRNAPGPTPLTTDGRTKSKRGGSIVNHHLVGEDTVVVRHAFEDNLPPETDDEFEGFLFENLF